WNMGWMNDTLDYIKREPIHRRYHHHQMTFGMHYAFSENFVLPISHDEVVHGKGSMLQRMPGDGWERFANLRAYYGFMWGHPGKKLLFMGCEFAQPGEWKQAGEIDWEAAKRPAHEGVQRLVRDLNTLYRATPALHAKDCESEGFQWIEANAADDSIYAWIRRGGPDDPAAVVICNFTPVERRDWRCGLPLQGKWREALNTDAGIYGGGNRGNMGGVMAKAGGWHGQACSAPVTLPPLSTVILVHEGHS
ncbi:MAG: alpha amylase C-terminal domain-containing protein, partial [Oricola sp.]